MFPVERAIELRMIRRAATLVLCVLALPACGDDAGRMGVVPDAPPPPHTIVLLTLDTLRADHLPWHGYPRNTAPFLADLARRSTVFLDALATTSNTAPSHGSMLTGLYPSQHGVTRNGGELSPSITTLAEILGAAGYESAAFTSVIFLDGVAKGFDEFHDAGVTEYELRHGLAKESFRHAVDTVAAARSWLQQRTSDKPLFLWVHLFDVHEWKDHDPPQDVLDRLHAEDLAAGLGDGKLVRWLVEEQALDPDWFELEKALGPALGNIDRYDGAISVVDRAAAELFDAVSAVPGGDDALWIVLGDHGEGFTNHHLLGHSRHVYNEQLRVPLLVHGSHGRWSPSRVRGVVQPIDIVPTLIEITGATLPPTRREVGSPALARRSWLPLLRGEVSDQRDNGAAAGVQTRPGEPGSVVLPETAPRTDAAAPLLLDAAILGERLAFSERRPMDEHQRENGWTGGETRVLQETRYKLITHDESPVEFFDLAADPLELHDLAESPPFEFMHYVQMLGEQDGLLRNQAAAIGAGQVNPEHLDELRRLGYLK